MAKVKRFRSYQYRPDTVGEVNNSKSLTKPGKSLSLAEIIRRGQSDLIQSGSQAQPYFNEDMVIPDFRFMSKTDINEWRDSLDAQIEKVQKEVQDEKDAIAKAKLAQEAREASEALAQGQTDDKAV